MNASIDSLQGRVAEIRRHLRSQAARIQIDTPAWTAERLRIPITVENLTGHKFPTAYPSRRVWLQVVVRDAAGATAFSSGTVNQDGCLVDDQENVLPCEIVGGPVAPHRTQIESSTEVQIYESVMQDPTGRPTFRLLRGAAFGKDNRVLPQGWSPEHPDAATTASVGTTSDDDFRSGSDQVVYSVALNGNGPWTIEATLNYQSLSARHLAELVTHDTPEIRRFTQLLTPEMRRPEVVAQTTLTWTRKAVGSGEP